MDSTQVLVRAAADVLEAPTAGDARARLAEALRDATGTDIVSRVSFTRRSVSFFATAPRQRRRHTSCPPPRTLHCIRSRASMPGSAQPPLL